MAKIKKKFIEKVPLDIVPDGVERMVVTNTAQEFKGLKTFMGNVSVKPDTNNGEKTLITMAEVDTLLSTLPTAMSQTFTLTDAEIAANGVPLAKPCAPKFASVTKFKCIGSDWFYAFVDFTISGTSLTWADNQRLKDNLRVGDKVVVHYIG